MAIRMPRVLHAKKILRPALITANYEASSDIDVSKGCLAVYVGEGEKKRFVIPTSMLNQPLFQYLPSQAEEEFGFTIPCPEDIFIDLVSRLS